jgi:hypothetical protein
MDLKEQVAALRAEGLTPKQIARRLGLRPAEVSTIVQSNAAAVAAKADPTVLPPVVGCLINRGWSAGLGLRDVPADWHDAIAEAAGCAQGLVSVAVARQHRHGKIAFCGYLVDVGCLGVKDALGPRVISAEDWGSESRRYFDAYDEPPVDAPLGLAQCLVLGAAEFTVVG